MEKSAITLWSARAAGLSPDLRLAATLFLPSGEPREATGRAGAPGLVVGHGAGSRAARHEEFCHAACERGFVVLALDFRGHGDSSGEADGALEQDLVAAAQYLRALPRVDPDRVCYRGSSMAGFYGLKAAPPAGFSALALICPAGEDTMLRSLSAGPGQDAGRDTEAPDPTAGATLEQPRSAPGTTRWDRPRLCAYFEAQDSREIAARVRCPVLIVHARPDQQVPFEHSLLLAAHLPADTTLLALSSGSHTTAQHDPAIHEYTLDWLLAAIRAR